MHNWGLRAPPVRRAEWIGSEPLAPSPFDRWPPLSNRLILQRELCPKTLISMGGGTIGRPCWRERVVRAGEGP
jgi:hypothetical protein